MLGKNAESFEQLTPGAFGLYKKSKLSPRGSRRTSCGNDAYC